MRKVHWPSMNKFVCKLHGYIVYFLYNITLGESTKNRNESSVIEHHAMLLNK